MFRKSFVIVSQCKSVRSLQNVQSNRAIHSLFLHSEHRNGRFAVSLVQKSINKRFLSSNNIIHKMFFVSADSPSKEDIISNTSEVFPHQPDLPSNSPGFLINDSTYQADVPSNSSEVFNNETIYPDNISLPSDTVTYIPPPPAPPEALEIPLTALGEPTFASMGLGTSWTPVSLALEAIEYIHVCTGLPWWGTIAVATAILRLALFPIVIISQRNSALMTNYMPGMNLIQEKISNAKQSGNFYEAAKLTHELQQYMDKTGMKPIRTMLMPFVQAPIFVSMFMALRKCSNLPVESMTEGGLYWFIDLTVMDPYYILPVMTSLTMLATIKLGTDSVRLSSHKGKVIKYVMTALPFMILPFMIHFPAVILCYWLTTNMFSLVQVGFLRIPRVRAYFNIERLLPPVETTVSGEKKGFFENLKDGFDTQRLAKEMEGRSRMDEIRFKSAGTGPLVETYKHNPLEKRKAPYNTKGRHPSNSF